MLLLLGWAIVFIGVIGGFIFNGGRIGSLLHPGEYIIILSASIGFVVGASPPSLLKVMGTKILQAMSGTPYTRDRYVDLIKSLYELFQVAREQGVVGIEEHVMNPSSSSIFGKYPSFSQDHHAMAFMQDALKPLIDGRMKGDQLKVALRDDIDRIAMHIHQPVMVMTKVADALPGLGIVAAVLGICVTMGYIAGAKEVIGEKVAAALVGTFLGLFISYGFIQPLVTKIEFMNEDELSYYDVMSNMIVSYATGAPPVMAAEAGRRAIPSDRQPESEEMETILKSLKKAA